MRLRSSESCGEGEHISQVTNTEQQRKVAAGRLGRKGPRNDRTYTTSPIPRVLEIHGRIEVNPLRYMDHNYG